jgi:hypothetical protein
MEVSIPAPFMEEPHLQLLDLHPGNVCFPAPESHLIEESILRTPSHPRPSFLRRRDGMPLFKNIPAYVVKPTPLPKGAGDMTIIDSGHSFLLPDTGPLCGTGKDFHLPIGRQPPELCRGSGFIKWPQKVDSWAM